MKARAYQVAQIQKMMSFPGEWYIASATKQKKREKLFDSDRMKGNALEDFAS